MATRTVVKPILDATGKWELGEVVITRKVNPNAKTTLRNYYPFTEDRIYMPAGEWVPTWTQFEAVALEAKRVYTEAGVPLERQIFELKLYTYRLIYPRIRELITLGYGFPVGLIREYHTAGSKSTGHKINRAYLIAWFPLDPVIRWIDREKEALARIQERQRSQGGGGDSPQQRETGASHGK